MATTLNAALRPGVATGPYPERAREHEREGWVQRSATRAAGWLRQRSRGRPQHHDAFVTRVEKLDAVLRELDEQGLDEAIRGVRRALRTQSMSAPVAARAFALVREVAARTIGLRPFPVQIAGAWSMLNGRIAEMQTGEGKTLTATLTAATAALAGIPVHVITVNDYLVTRDAQAMGPVYERLGLTVAAVVDGMSREERRDRYACDVVFVSNKQIAFDYLRDRIALGTERNRYKLEVERLHEERPRLDSLVLRGLCFAIVDEADSVLIDEARTPLIISRAGNDPYQAEVYGQALELARALDEGSEFVQRPAERVVELTERGRERLEMQGERLGGVWAGARRREELVRLALGALHLYLRDHHYLVSGGKVCIVDEFTGRVMPDRSWEHGLHQMIERKEGVELTGQMETIARISYQRFFRRYLRLAGMTGTASEVAGELWRVYGLAVSRVPTHRPCRRVMQPTVVYAYADAKWRAVVERVARHHGEGRPVLVGTRSVEASEHLSALLDARGVSHVVLNARQDEQEAEIVARAGQRGQVTVATNMAGRGTDIELGDGVAATGGLHAVATERHESRRIDRQLYGRSARQGDPGRAEALVSLEDEVVTSHGRRVLSALACLVPRGRPLPRWLGNAIVAGAQARAERRHALTRRDLLEVDERLGDLLAFSGRLE